jgi:signal transduction histidine kinase/ligand-binding sensor domain-containing protein/DNA-binding response OmpR family regulator
MRIKLLRFINILIPIATLLYNLIYTQTTYLKFKHLTITEGLSNNEVRCIIQDNRGFMWFGTANGLNKYDGYSFTIYKNDTNDPNSLGANNVHAILEDRSGNLWIGTKGGGLNLYNREKDNFIVLKKEQNNSTSIIDNIINCIYEDSQGNIWIGTQNGGLEYFNRTDTTFIHHQFDPKNSRSISNNKVNDIIEDKYGNFWIATNNGLNLLDRDTGKFTRYYYRKSCKNTLSDNTIYDLYEDYEGGLWIATSNGLNFYNRQTDCFNRFMNDPATKNSITSNTIFSISGDGKNFLFIGTENGGLNIFDLKNRTFYHYIINIDDDYCLNSNSIYSIYYSNDILWLGTFNGGINFTSKQIQGIRHYKVKHDGLNNPYILCIKEDRNGNLWIGTDGGGINFLDRNSGEYTYYTHDKNDPSSLSVNEVTAILEDSQGNILIGTYQGGLDLFNPQTKKFTHFRHNPEDVTTISHNFVHTIFQDSQGELLIGTGAGIDCYDRETNTFNRLKYPIIDTGVLSIIEDSQNNLWVGTYGGLRYVCRKTDGVKNFNRDRNDKGSLISDITTALYEDSKGHLWIGTLENGLYRFNNETQKFVRYKLDEDIINYNISSIVEDQKGNLWLSTDQSIIKVVNAIYMPDKVKFINFGIYHGLRSLFKSKSGEIFFGGNYGLNAFSPNDIVQNSYIPPVMLTNFKIFNKDVGIDKAKSPLKKHISETRKITLAHNQSVITFEFAALNYILPEKNQYAFIMEGFEKEWNYVKNKRSATYTNLDPGEYVFKIKGSNNDGIWNEKGASIRIIIIPPWWKTTWAYIFYLMITGFLIYVVWRFQLNKERIKHELKLEHMHAEKLEEIDRIKTRFFSNITHEFRTPLSLIMGPIKEIISSNIYGQFKAEFKMILRNSEKLYQLINQLLDLSKLEAGYLPLQTRKENIIYLLEELVMSFASLAEFQQICLQLSIMDHSDKREPIDVYLDKDKFEQIISNLLSNAIKFTPEGGNILVSVKKNLIDTDRTEINNSNNSSRLMKISKKLKNKILQKKIGKLSDSAHTTASEDAKKRFVDITIQDNGIGIPGDNINKIFDRFYQVNDSYTRKHEGTGIGLAITKELVELHHGTIHVESQYGKGTKFTIRLPLGKDHLKENEIIEELAIYRIKNKIPDRYSRNSLYEDNKEEHDLDLYAKSKISSKQKLPLLLVIEDNTDLRKYLARSLNHDYQIMEAEDGQIGYLKAIEQIPDLIVSDIMMPKMDGFKLCEKIKTDQRTSHIPIILLTAKASEKSKIEGLEIGADDYITKPFEIKELQIRIRNLIEQRRQLRMYFNRKAGLKPEEIVTTSADKEFLKKAMTILEENISNPNFGVDKFSRKIALSKLQLYRKIRALTGQSPSEFIRVVRLNRAAQLLKHHYDTVTQIAFMVGFNSSSYFSRSFYKQFGVWPSEYSAV